MPQPSRRLQISFDRERDALRGIVDAVSSLRKNAPAPPKPAESAPSPKREDVEDLPWLDDVKVPAPRRIPISKASGYLASLADAYGPLPPSAIGNDIPFVDTLVIDSSALSELAAGNTRARALVARAVGSLSRIVVPATELRTAMHQRIADLVADVVPIDVAHARVAARLMLAAPGSDPYDALAVACVARAEKAAIVTTMAARIDRLVRASERENVHVFSV